MGQTTVGTIAAGAGAAAAGPLGAALGGALGNIVGGLFGGNKDKPVASTLEEQLKDAGPGVFSWVKTYAPIVFVEWVFKNHPNSFGSVAELQALYAAWAYGFNGSVVNPDNANFGGLSLSVPYAAMGIDYGATVNKARAAGGYPSNLNRARELGLVVMVPGGGAPGAPLPAVNELKRIEEQGAQTAAERAIDRNLGKAAGGYSFNFATIIPLLVILAMVFIALKFSGSN